MLNTNKKLRKEIKELRKDFKVLEQENNRLNEHLDSAYRETMNRIEKERPLREQIYSAQCSASRLNRALTEIGEICQTEISTTEMMYRILEKIREARDDVNNGRK